MREVLAACDAYGDQAVFITRVDAAAVLGRASELDGLPADQRGPLHGVPFAVKDDIDVAGFASTMGMAGDHPPATTTATVVQRALDSGAVLIGKTNLDQFVTGLVDVRSPYGAPYSVLNDKTISGRSSSGSGVAVAAHLVSFAYGTDTAGSGRVPAGFNYIVGLKPTKGIVPTTGVLPANKSQDCVSVFALSARDGEIVRGIITGADRASLYSRIHQSVALPKTGPRIGVPSAGSLEFFGNHVAAAAFDAPCATLAHNGFTLAPFDFDLFAATARLLYDTARVPERAP